MTSEMSNSTCYWQTSRGHWNSSSQPSFDKVKPCGYAGSDIQLCCWNNDTCMSDSICRFKHPLDNGSDYYIGGCTDATYSDPVCSKHCCKFFSAMEKIVVMSTNSHTLISRRSLPRYCLQQYFPIMGLLFNSINRHTLQRSEP